MTAIMAIVGWVLGLLLLPGVLGVAFARYIGMMIALNDLQISALELVDSNISHWSRRIGAGAVPAWIALGLFWVVKWEVLRWFGFATCLLVVVVWIRGVRSIKRDLGLL